MDGDSRFQEQDHLGPFALVVRLWIKLFHLGLVVFLVEAIARAGTGTIGGVVVAARAVIRRDPPAS